MSKSGDKTKPHIKSPTEVLDFPVNWNSTSKPFLGADTIATSTWIMPAGITKDLDTHTTTTTTIWLSGGALGTKYGLLNRITTTGGRTGEKTVYVKIKAK